MSLLPDELFDRFEIEFDAGPEPVFHGGELITGSLRVNLKQQITINAIRLQFKGHACNALESNLDLNEKIYFDKDFILLERPPGRLKPGHFPWNANFTYSLPFECPLPKGCPTSYESPFAYIRYFARCIIETDQQDKQNEYFVKKAISIVSPPELRHLLPMQPEDPVSRQDVATFGSCCCRGKITAKLTLAKSSYAPGENVFGTLLIDCHHSQYIVNKIEVRLVDRVKLVSNDETLLLKSNKNLTSKLEDRNEQTTTEADALIDNNQLKEKSKKIPKAKKRMVKTYYKMNAPISTNHVSSLHSKSQSKCDKLRVIFLRKLEKDDITNVESSSTQTDLFLLTIPPIPPSTISNDEALDSALSNQILSIAGANNESSILKLLESPSTATLRYRRKPFISIDYALQISIGHQIVIEIPINIYSIPNYANDIAFRPFAAGPQTISDLDEIGKVPFHGPFVFEPLYPTYITSPKPVQLLDSRVIVNSATTIVTLPSVTQKSGSLAFVNENNVPNGIKKTTTITANEDLITNLSEDSKIINHKQIITTLVKTTVSDKSDFPSDANNSIPIVLNDEKFLNLVSTNDATLLDNVSINGNGDNKIKSKSTSSLLKNNILETVLSKRLSSNNVATSLKTNNVKQYDNDELLLNTNGYDNDFTKNHGQQLHNNDFTRPAPSTFIFNKTDSKRDENLQSTLDPDVIQKMAEKVDHDKNSNFFV